MKALSDETILALLPINNITKRVTSQRSGSLTTRKRQKAFVQLLAAGPRTKLSIYMGRFPSIFQAKLFTISRSVEINLQRNYQR